MKKKILLAVLLGTLTLGSAAEAVGANSSGPNSNAPAWAVALFKHGWVAKTEDSICGLSDLKKLSSPSKVRYDELKGATPELKKMRDKNIDPTSPEGIQLEQAAVDRVRSASDVVRGERGHCSVWRTIRHKDGRTISDITDLVKAKF